ncbi:MAG: TolC family protein [Termitinemataceae bacterium]
MKLRIHKNGNSFTPSSRPFYISALLLLLTCSWNTVLVSQTVGPTPTLPLSLEQYLQRVSEKSQDLNIARRNIMQAELGVKQAKSSLFPRINLQVGYARNFLDITQPYPVAADTGSGSDPAPLIYQSIDINKDNSFSLGLSATQVIFDMRAYDALKYGREFENLMKTGLKEAERSLRNAAKKLYFLGILLQEVKKVKESSERNAFEVYQDMKRRYTAGVVQELEVLRAEVNWKMKRSEVSQAVKDVEVAVLNLKTLGGIPAATSVVLTEKMEFLPSLPAEILPDTVLPQRSDYELLLRQKRMAELSVALAKDEAYPSVAGVLSWARNYEDNALRFRDPTDFMQLGIQVTVPLYTGGAVSSKVAGAILEVEKKDLELNKLRDSISTELSRLHLSLKEAKERVDTASALKETAEQAYKLAARSHQNGLLTTLELNDAAVQLEGARLQYTIAHYDYLSAYFDWETALGK